MNAVTHQDPDDHICRPCAFRRYDPDGSTEKSFFVRSAWALNGVKTLGELVVRESADGPLIKILLEPSQ